MEDKSRILIVDDEPGIRELIREYMALEGYLFEEASDGVEALNAFKNADFDLVLLDVMMPKIDGWTVLREIRKTSQVPVIMLSARGEEYDRLFGFELGVDDYLVKPFSPKELMARMKVIFRRASPAPVKEKSKKLEYPGLSIDLDSHDVLVNGETVSLTPKEYDLLCFFAQNPRKVFSREQLLNSVWGYDFIGDDRTVDTHVKMLRETLGSYRVYIRTIWGTGYKFEAGEKK